MKRLFFLCTILFTCLLLAHAEDPRKSYDMGFDTISVLDYKKALKKDGEKIPKFPPRSGNAVIVQSVKNDSRAAIAGLEDLDLIRIVNGRLLRSAADADKIFKEVTYKDELELGVVRRSMDKWERVKIKLTPITEQEYFDSKLFYNKRFDEEFNPFVMVYHEDAPFSKYSHRNIQLYFRKVDRQPPILCLRMSLLVRTKVDWGEFVIKTDNATYKVGEEKKIDNQEEAFNAKLAEANKLVKLAEKEAREADKTSKAAEETYLAEFKDFKVDKNRKDEKYKKLVQRRLKSLKYCEELAKVAVEAAQNFGVAVKNSKQILEKSLEYSREKQKQNEQQLTQARERAQAAFNQLKEFEADLVSKSADKISQGISPSPLALTVMEEVGFEGPKVIRLRIKQGWRWYDAPLNKEQKRLLEDILSSSTVKIYHESDQNRGFNLTPQHKEQMKFILRVFEAEGGKVTE
ncbi:hypothetical protein [Gimesia aquarii]|uniref:PDZ domain-containing protein n=1 Tax=Gimesia aquarii TaxID=2527964 RepID=A0A517VSQ1_9PLAN|nr:hypothetical protein [Gimesia aquarii]QDT95979.1 hypothetical protein V144x_14310 [Gimesia aquarii]